MPTQRDVSRQVQCSPHMAPIDDSPVLVPWGVLGQGRFKSPEELKSRSRVRGGGPPDEAELKLCKVLQEVADELGGKYSLANGL